MAEVEVEDKTSTSTVTGAGAGDGASASRALDVLTIMEKLQLRWTNATALLVSALANNAAFEALCWMAVLAFRAFCFAPSAFAISTQLTSRPSS